MREFTLYLDESGLHAYQAQHGSWACQASFSETTAGYQAFALFLQSHAQHRLCLLCDLPLAHIEQDSIPPARGKDRQMLIERRLVQHFPHHPLRLAESAGHTAGAPNKEQLLLQAISPAEKLAPWLSALSKEHSHLHGIYNTSQLVWPLLKSCTAPPTALLFLLEGSTLRQYFIKNSYLQLMRSLPDGQTEPAWLDNEAHKLRQFLLSQRHIERDTTLPIYLLTESRASGEGTSFQHLPLSTPLATFFLKLLQAKRPSGNFATAEQLSAGKLARLRLAGLALASLLSLGALALSASLHLDIQRLNAETGAWRDAASQLAADTQAAGPDSAESLASLRQLTNHYQILQSMQRTPEASFISLSQILDQHPDIHLEQLDWQNGEGAIQLHIEGHIGDDGESGQTASEDETARLQNAFFAALRVDRDIQSQATSPGNNRQAAVRGSTGQAQMPPNRHFSLDLRERP